MKEGRTSIWTDDRGARDGLTAIRGPGWVYLLSHPSSHRVVPFTIFPSPKTDSKYLRQRSCLLNIITKYSTASWPRRAQNRHTQDTKQWKISHPRAPKTVARREAQQG